MIQKDFNFIVDKAKSVEKPLRVVIAGADAENILKGAFYAEEDGFVELTLVGDQEKITAMLKTIGLADRKYTIVHEDNKKNYVQKSIDLIKAGKADCLMRGNTQTRNFLLPILDRKNDLLIPHRLVTHIVMLKLQGYDRLISLSDVTLLVDPSPNQRKKVVKNMTNTLKCLGYEHPNIALLSLVEKPSFHMKDTIESDNIVKEHNSHPIADCNLVGPIAYDLIMSKEAARLKNYDCPYCGEFDGIVVPNLLSGNLLIKAMQLHGRAESCGILVGAKIPVAITSRSDTPDKAYLSLAVCATLTSHPDYKMG